MSKVIEVRTVKRSRGSYVCGNCKDIINPGDSYRWWPVRGGGYVARCMKAECDPPAELTATVGSSDEATKAVINFRTNEAQAIAHIEGRKVEVTPIGKGMFKLTLRRVTMPFYATRDELMDLAGMSATDMIECIKTLRQPTRYTAMDIEEPKHRVAEQDDETGGLDLSRMPDAVLMMAEDYLRANDGLGLDHGLTCDAFVAANIRESERSLVGRYSAALEHAMLRRGALRGHSAEGRTAYYPTH